MGKRRKIKFSSMVVVVFGAGMLVGCSGLRTDVLRNGSAFEENMSWKEETEETAGESERVKETAGESEKAEKTAKESEKAGKTAEESEKAEKTIGASEKTKDIGEELYAADRYVYSTLSETEQVVYAEIYRTLLEYAEEVMVSTRDKTLLDKAYNAVYADYGEIFWSSSYAYTEYTDGGNVRELKFSPKYTISLEEKEEKKQQIDAAVEKILSGAPMGGTDYEKALYVYEYLVNHVEYDAEATDNQNIVSVFLNGRTVCEGYARATQYLLERMGIQSAVVGGMAKGASHAWNLVRLDGEYYYLDTTWGDRETDTDAKTVESSVNYNYFAVTSEELFRTHTPANNIELPECTATVDNYYNKEGLYISGELTPGEKLVKDRYETGNTRVSVKFSNAALYEEAYTRWITDNGIFELCSGLTNLSYIEDREMYVITFIF